LLFDTPALAAVVTVASAPSVTVPVMVAVVPEVPNEPRIAP
jgi:hypothetical protein